MEKKNGLFSKFEGEKKNKQTIFHLKSYSSCNELGKIWFRSLPGYGKKIKKLRKQVFSNQSGFWIQFIAALTLTNQML